MYQPDSWQDFYSGFCVTIGCIAAAASCIAWGRLICGPAIALELALVAGWGVLSVMGTLLGCLSLEAHAVRFAVDVWIASGAALLAPCVVLWASRGRYPGRFTPIRLSAEDAMLAWRVGLVALPMLMAVWGIVPGLIDSYTHWIPNLVHLADLGTFPRSADEAPLSRYPAFPYGLQMLAYAATRIGGWLGGNEADPTALMRTSLVLQLAAAAMLTRELCSGWLSRHAGRGLDFTTPATIPGWPVVLIGFLLTVPLNPFFYPKVQLSPYGDAATSVALAGCLISARDTLKDSRLSAWISLAMAAAALVATKQANFVLAGSVFVAAGAWSLRATARPATWARLATAAIPCVLTFVVWRSYVGSHLPGAENMVLAPSRWDLSASGEILLAMLVRLARSPPELLLLFVGVFIGLRDWWRPATARSGLPAVTAVVAIAYQLFLFAVYVTVFGGEHATAALSFERFNSHLSVGLLLVLAPYLGRVGALLEARSPATATLVAVPLLSMMAGISMVFLSRYDLTSGIADAADIARAIVAVGAPDKAIAIATPNERLPFAAIRIGVAAADSRFRATRFIDLSDKVTSPDGILASGAGFAVISCNLAREITGKSGPVLIERKGGAWSTVAAPPVHHRVFNVRTAPFRTIFLDCKRNGP